MSRRLPQSERAARGAGSSATDALLFLVTRKFAGLRWCGQEGMRERREGTNEEPWRTRLAGRLPQDVNIRHRRDAIAA